MLKIFFYALFWASWNTSYSNCYPKEATENVSLPSDDEVLKSGPLPSVCYDVNDSDPVLYTHEYCYPDSASNTETAEYYVSKKIAPCLNADVTNTFIVQIEGDRHSPATHVLDSVRNFKDVAKFLGVKVYITFVYTYPILGFAFKTPQPEKIFLFEKSFRALNIAAIVPDEVVFLNAGDETEIGSYQIRAKEEKKAANMSNGEGIGCAIIHQGIRPIKSAFCVPNKTCENIGDEGNRIKVVYDFVSPKYETFEILKNLDEEHWDCNAPEPLEPASVYGDQGTMLASVMGGTAKDVPGVSEGMWFIDIRAFNGTQSRKTWLYAAINLAFQTRAVDIILLPTLYHPGFWEILGTGPYFNYNRSKELLIIGAAGEYGRGHSYLKVFGDAPLRGVIEVDSLSYSMSHGYQAVIQLSNDDQKTFLMEPLSGSAPIIPFAQQFYGKIAVFEAGFDHFLVNTCSFIGPGKNFFAAMVICNNKTEFLAQLARIKASQSTPNIVFIISSRKLSSVTFEVPVWQFRLSKVQKKELETVLKAKRIHSLILDSLQEIDQTIEPTRHKLTSVDLRGGLKSDVSAYGGNILAFSGTGLVPYKLVNAPAYAAAVVAGVAANYAFHRRQRGQNVTFEDFQARLKNSADPLHNSDKDWILINNNSMDASDRFIRPVVGAIQIDAMMQAKVKITNATLNLNPGEIVRRNGVVDVWLTFENQGNENVTYQIDYISCQPYGTLRQSPSQFHSSGQPLYPYLGPFKRRPVSVPSVLIRQNRTQKVHFAFYSLESFHDPMLLIGFLRFTPLEFRKHILVLNPRPMEGYGVLFVPYFALRGNDKTPPFAIGYGREYDPFLTDSLVKEYNENYRTVGEIFWTNRSHQLESQDVPTYTLSGTSKPVLAMCFLLPLKQIDFYLKQATGKRSVLGRLETLRNLPSGCYLIPFNSHAVPYGIELNQRHPASTSFGWDGRLWDFASRRVDMILNGTYAISVTLVPDLESEAIVKQRWSSTIFEIRHANASVKQ